MDVELLLFLKKINLIAKHGWISFSFSKINSEPQEPTYKKLSENFVRDLITYNAIEENDNQKHSITNIYGTFEKELGRSLSPVEIEKIREWVSQGIKEEVIIDSLHECMTKNKRVTIRSIDKIIIKRLSSKDLKEEGYSAVNDKWKKELEDTIDIANTKWTDD